MPIYPVYIRPYGTVLCSLLQSNISQYILKPVPTVLVTSFWYYLSIIQISNCQYHVFLYFSDFAIHFFLEYCISFSGTVHNLPSFRYVTIWWCLFTGLYKYKNWYQITVWYHCSRCRQSTDGYPGRLVYGTEMDESKVFLLLTYCHTTSTREN